MTATSSEPGTRRRPVHLWVVGVVSLLWNAMGAVDYTMTQTKNEAYMAHFTPEQLEFFYGFPAWVVSCWAIAVWGAVLGSILLLLRRKAAAPVFAVSFVAMLGTTFHNFVLADGMKIMGGVAPLVFCALIFLAAAALVWYAYAMRKKGVLR